MGYVRLSEKTFRTLPISSKCDEYKDFKLLNKLNIDYAHATMYDACKEGKCDYIAKVVRLKNSKDLTVFRMETLISFKMGDRNIGPKVFSTFTCENNTKGVIIFEKYDVDMEDFFYEGHMKKLLRKIDGGAQEQFIHDFFAHMWSLVKRMHDAGIFHNDLFVKNLMVKVDGLKYKIVIIDYGMSIPFGKPLDSTLRGVDAAGLLFGYLVHERSKIRWVNHFTRNYISYALKVGLTFYSRAVFEKGIQARINSKGTIIKIFSNKKSWIQYKNEKVFVIERPKLTHLPKTNVGDIYKRILKSLDPRLRDVIFNMGQYTAWLE